MKKLMIIAAALICSVATAEAQSWKDALKKAATKAATQATTTTTTTTTETATPPASNSTASVLGNLASSLIGSVLGTQVTQESIVGTWTYTKPAVQFTTEDLLKKAGGVAAASVVEEKLAEGLGKIGVKEGVMKYTFNEDKSFEMVIGKRTVKGTYELDNETKEVTLNFGSGKLDLNIAKLTMTLTKTGNNIDLVSNADKLLKLIQTTISTSKNSTLSTIGSLVSGYDGMMIGFSFTK
ncbi:MAG: DUF4923 family protein [Rikenellaceae bacterium]|nr:DUF4923 family protein [Rikenellaceae bacterium]